MYRRMIALILIALLVCLPACSSQTYDDTQTTPPTQSDTQTTEPTVPSDPTIPEDQEPTEDETTLPPEEDGWEIAAPSGSLESTEPQEPDEGATESSGQEDTQPSGPSQAELEGVPEDYTPWG